MTFTTDAILSGDYGLNRSYDIISPVGTSHEDEKNRFGPVIGPALQAGAGLNRPLAMTGFGPGKVFCAQYYGQPRVFDINTDGVFTVSQSIPIAYQNANAGDGMRYCVDADYNGTDKVAITTYSHHCVKVYNTSDWSLAFVIGTVQSAGATSAGKLYNPRSARWLPNGNLIVASYNGAGDSGGAGGINHGHITEYDGTTGALIANRMVQGSGTSATGTNRVYRPMQAVPDPTDPNILWVNEYGRNKILKVDMTTWLTVGEIFGTATAQISSPWSFGVGTDKLFIGNNGSRQECVILNKSDGSEHAVFTKTETGHGGAYSYGSFFECQPGYVLIPDWNINQVIRIPIEKQTTVSYNAPAAIPTGWEIERVFVTANMVMDELTWVADIPVSDLSSIGDVAVLIKRT